MNVRLCSNAPSFRYDIETLLFAFFPGMRVLKDGEEISPDYSVTVVLSKDRVRVLSNGTQTEEMIPEEADRIMIKNAIKRSIYRAVGRDTKRSLPWGTLTGIRPTRIATSLLAQGKRSDEIRDWYRENYYTGEDKADLSIAIAKREQEILSGKEREDKATESLLQGKERDVSLYIHIPFCPSVCDYCSFSAGTIDAHRDHIVPYLDALREELRFAADLMRGQMLRTVYIGGGTPTALPEESFETLLSMVKDLFPVHDVWEYTVEAGRPDTITPGIIAKLREAGVGRISINPQTMQEKTLRAIGRNHTVEDVERAFDVARQGGFAHINTDIIVGLPGEGIDEVKDTLSRIEALSPDALTVHALARKRASRYGEAHLIPTMTSEGIMEETERAALRMGMTPYYLYRQKNMAGNLENIGYAGYGHAGIYNIIQMEEIHSVVACGAGAISKYVPPDGKNVRCANVSDVAQYMARLPEMIGRKEAVFRQGTAEEEHWS